MTLEFPPSPTPGQRYGKYIWDATKGVWGSSDPALLVDRVELLEDARRWIPAIPSGIGSTGAVATLDTDTGIVTLPTGTTHIRLDNIFHPDWETEVTLDLEVAGPNSTDHSAWMRMSEGGVTTVGVGYNVAGAWAQYNGTWGVYSVNGAAQAAVGAISGTGYVFFKTTIQFRSTELNENSTAKQMLFDFISFSGGSARGVQAGGYTPGSTPGFDGVGFWFGGSFTSPARGTVRAFKRKLVV